MIRTKGVDAAVLRKICIVAEHYPTEEEPLFPFVQQLAYSLTREGIECHIIAPQIVTRNLVHHKKKKPTYSVEFTPEKLPIYVHRPLYFTISNLNNKRLQKLVERTMGEVIWKVIDKISAVDAIYCYFWHVALTVANSNKYHRIPLFVQASECNLTVSPYMITEVNLKKISGVVCASRKNQIESVEANLTKEEDTCVIVNGYRTDEFYPQDQKKARAMMGYDPNAFIIAFVGGFIERKGIRELCEAVERIGDVQSIFIGTGALPPSCRNILFQGSVSHNQIVHYLNCADIFVLPTKAEGCCNAIIEALACGLPVVSSNKSFNDEILNDDCSIRLDETNVNEITTAINLLRNNPKLRNAMSKAALDKAATLTIEHRSKSIIRYINERIC